MTRKFSVYIRDMLQNMLDSQDFIRGMSYEEFTADKKTINAVLRSIEVIGEAVKHIPDDIRNIYPIVPWKEMAGMRDKVIHFYFGVDVETVWLVVKERIPEIMPILYKILADLESQGI
ncbi:MAG TPA: DUF86 domain-containing protein [Anaerolineales bacterium]|nr:DUF86 domain-containing protein [Anaerolineales bacterium]